MCTVHFQLRFLSGRSVGVSNFGVQHLEGLREAGLPAPSVNQFELHPFSRLAHIVEYCRKTGTAVMGYSPIAQGKKMDDPDLIRISQRYVGPNVFLVGLLTLAKAQLYRWLLSRYDIVRLEPIPGKAFFVGVF